MTRVGDLVASETISPLQGYQAKGYEKQQKGRGGH